MGLVESKNTTISQMDEQGITPTYRKYTFGERHAVVDTYFEIRIGVYVFTCTYVYMFSRSFQKQLCK